MITQQMTDAQLIAAAATSTPTFPSPNSSNAKPSYPQQSPATISLNSSQMSQVQSTPLDLMEIPNHPTNTSSNNNMCTHWAFLPCQTSPAPPLSLKPMVANMHYKPQLSPQFMTMLSHKTRTTTAPLICIPFQPSPHSTSLK